ncbi:hypothetical protein HDV57DRAFT_82875 [Trichoderma longibrachiatum]
MSFPMTTCGMLKSMTQGRRAQRRVNKARRREWRGPVECSLPLCVSSEVSRARGGGGQGSCGCQWRGAPSSETKEIRVQASSKQTTGSLLIEDGSGFEEQRQLYCKKTATPRLVNAAMMNCHRYPREAGERAALLSRGIVKGKRQPFGHHSPCGTIATSARPPASV